MAEAVPNSPLMQRWISPRDLRPNARMRLFCLPHAGSGAAGFHRWKAELRRYDIDVCPVMLPGRETRLAEPPVRNANALISSLMATSETLLDRPYAIFGHSMGALLALAWTRAIESAGLPLPRWLIVSGRNAPHAQPPPVLLHRLPDREFVAQLEQRYGSMAPGLLDDPELRAIFLPILRADLTLVETFPAAPPHGLACPLLALAGQNDRAVTDLGLENWRAYTAAGFRRERLPGGHFFHLAEGQSALLALIAELLDPPT